MDPRRPAADAGRSAAAPDRGRGSGSLLLVLSYVPLLVHELQTIFSEVQAALAFLAGGGEPSSMSLPVRFLVVGLRVLAWPLVGLITEAPVAAILAAQA